jgi:hypothetical protein
MQQQEHHQQEEEQEQGPVFKGIPVMSRDGG